MTTTPQRRRVGLVGLLVVLALCTRSVRSETPLERARQHWAFHPLKAVAVPTTKGVWAKTAIDHFVLHTLREEGLEPTPPLEARALARRISFDLVGLPPTPEEIDAFVRDHAKNGQAAVGALVDRLLQSTHYGERWGRHWLDVARYADSDGQEADRDRPHAYHYRNFVLRAFNEDMPFDKFVRWQIAGDEYEPKNAQALAATGFLTAGPNTVLADTFLKEELLRNRYNELDDIVSTLGTAMLGLTIGCARCHDHKYDALSAREYYQILAVFHSGDRKVIKTPDGTQALVFRDFGDEPKPSWLFERADFYDRDEPVTLNFPAVLMTDTDANAYWKDAKKERPLAGSTYQRQALAEWITDVEHGAGALLARVMVNRIWQHHFGEGIVRTPSDFGVRGDPPTHPVLLEWLAHDLVEHGWKIKRLHRLIVLSSAYQQGAKRNAEKADLDPENRLLWRVSPRRLEAEVLRDAVLAVSGTLNAKAYGKPFKPPIPSEAIVARNLKDGGYPKNLKETPETLRRSVYMFHKRVVPYPLMQAFDRPDLLQSCGKRDNTTVAPQALALLNDSFVRARAGEFAERLLRECGDDVQHQVRRSFELALGRTPTEQERQVCENFLRSREGDARKGLTDYCQSLFGLNEFIYVD